MEAGVGNSPSSPNSPAAGQDGDSPTVVTDGATSVSPPSPLPTYEMYPRYPSAAVGGDGPADPLALLIPLAVDQPERSCPDCDQPEELVPGAHWFACRGCSPATFETR
jgi:hypothetical protein